MEKRQNEILQIESKELHELSDEQAQEVLEEFLFEERKVFETLVIDSVQLDYSQSSVVQLFQYVIDQFKRSGKTEFEPGNIWLLRLAYYFGESLKRSSASLEWGLGNSETAHHNQVVITGFPNSVDAPVIIVSRNLVEAVTIDNDSTEGLIDGIDWWFQSPRKKKTKSSKKQ